MGLARDEDVLGLARDKDVLGLARDEDVLAVAQLNEVEDHIKLKKLLSNFLVGNN